MQREYLKEKESLLNKILDMLAQSDERQLKVINQFISAVLKRD